MRPRRGRRGDRQRGALISEVGDYAPPTLTGEAYVHRRDAVDLRLHHASIHGVVTTEADDAAGEPIGLWMFDGGDVAGRRGCRPARRAGRHPRRALMGGSGRCLALLAQLGLPTADVADAWRDAVGSLPGVGR
ncbi:hypothetical protein [Pseudonocardia sp. NPDC049154]|uniref:hypothetical protein n=1 Tax=Pseudonocardia sp. NPDC049154 TaxID=3155501 RepID=UPI0033F0BB5E